MKFTLPVSLLSLLLLVSCDPNRIYEYNYEFNDNAWNNEQSLVFDFAIEDTLQHYNMYINIRNSNEYLYRNMYLFLKITAPNGKYSIDTVQCVLADSKGKWLGKGSVNLIDNQILYKKNILFPAAGNYRVKFEQAMRDTVLKSVSNVGFRVEHTERPKSIDKSS